MNGNRTNRFLWIALAGGACLMATPTAWADGSATGTNQITNIQYGLVNPGDGTINWLYDDGLGNPAWQGEAWVQVADSQGGAGADYNTTPDGFGVISASASTALSGGSVDVDLSLGELYATNSATIPVDGWANTAPYGMMFDHFSLSPALPGSIDPIELAFSFDYQIHLTGQADPLGARYFSDASVSMLLEYEDAFGDWQLVPGEQLFYSEVISGGGTGSDDVTFSGNLSMTVFLDPAVMYSVQYTVYENVPEPATLGLLLAGSLFALRRRRGPQR